MALRIRLGSTDILVLHPNGTATGFNGHVDLGTGLQTALTQIVAEELDLPLEAVSIVLGNTASTPDQGPTIASESIQVAAVPMQHAAAQALAWLRLQAALRLNVPVGEVTSKDGSLSRGETRLAFGDLLQGEDVVLVLDETAPLKDPTRYRLIGKSRQRLDLPDKLRGAHAYVQDVSRTGMLHGHVIRPPYAGRDSGDFIGHSLIGFDAAAVADMPGFVTVFHEADFLAVLAESAHEAQRIAEALPVKWHLPPELPDMSDPVRAMTEAPSTPRLCDTAGDMERGLEECDSGALRVYYWPFHLHGSIGPSAAVAEWNDGHPVVWSGTQNPHMLRSDLALLVDLPDERIEVRRHQAAGCFGRNCADDVAGDALLLARACGRPVSVQLTRAQETLWEPKGAGQVMQVEGGLKTGDLHAYKFDTWYPSNRGPNLALLLTGRISPEPQPADMGDRTIIPPYRIPNKQITVHDMAPLVRAAWMRGVSALPNTFAHESFVDEMAIEAGEDPVAFRLRHLDDVRQADLVRRTAAEAGWEPRTAPRLRREGRMAFGQGMAFATYVHGTFPGTAAASAAWVVDVAVDMKTGEVSLTRVFVGQDQGLAINPDGVRQQIHGNVIQTASRTLQESVSFDEIRVTDQSWATYPVATFPQVPEIETMLISRPGDPPLGVGESAAVPAAAAIANAIFDATGVRMRAAPFTPERMRDALGILPEADAAIALPAPRRRRRISLLTGALGIGATLGLGALAMPMARAIPPSPAPAASTFSQETLTRGAQLYALGNCASCHTAEGGAPAAGGRPVETPFGTVYSTNITPDPDTGLGQWSYQAFARAMRKGIGRDGQNLYPAFPYTSFARMTDTDLQALYAHLQTITPVREETPKAQMAVPRPAIAVWNLLNPAGRLTADPTQDAEWNRGRYLVETIGHCGACHTPRNALGAERTDQPLTGTMVGDWYAPALGGWSKEALQIYLSTGTAEGHSAAAGPMAKVIAGTASLPSTDIAAMASYLSSLPGEPALPQEQAAPLPGRISRIYESACSACHEPGLADLLTAAQSSLSLSPALRAPVSDTAETVIREGLMAPDGTRLHDMPAFGSELSETDISALARYLRSRFAPDLPSWPAPAVH